MAVTASERLSEAVAPPPTREGLTFEKEWAMFQETDKCLDDILLLDRSIGELIEILVGAKLWEKFEDWNYGFKRFYQRLNIYEDNTYKVLNDVDLLLLDTDYAMVVEVKREADTGDVERHIIRMGHVKQYPPDMAKGKILIGAIAGGIITSEAINLAHANGFFVLRLRGESVELVSKKGEFEPKEWGRVG